MKIELDLPEIEGYELADGKQPRPAIHGDHYINMETLKSSTWGGDLSSLDSAIILKKKAPKYQVITAVSFLQKSGHIDLSAEYVEIKALEDALKLILGLALNGDDLVIYSELSALIN
jgi:hypothetical protein